VKPTPLAFPGLTIISIESVSFIQTHLLWAPGTDQFFFFVEQLDPKGDRSVGRKSSGMDANRVVQQRRISAEAEVDPFRRPVAGKGVASANWGRCYKTFISKNICLICSI
jgi:hypothetical protein